MMPEPLSTPIENFDPVPSWSWSKCREVGFRFEFWPLNWQIMTNHSSDQYCCVREWHVGPFVVGASFNVGWKNCQ